MIDVTVRMADGRQVGAIEIHCIEGTGRSPDAINTYEATVREFDTGTYCRDASPHASIVTVRHRYGDNWTVLLREILAALEVHR